MCGYAQDLARKLVPDRASGLGLTRKGIVLKGVGEDADGTWHPGNGFVLDGKPGMTLTL